MSAWEDQSGAMQGDGWRENLKWGNGAKSVIQIPAKESAARQAAAMQQFGTGATRSDDSNKPDYEGYLSPLVIEAYGRYMLEHQTQDDGVKRDSDNWQKGMPLPKYMKSLWRHVMQLWQLHRGVAVAPEKRAGILVPVTIESALMAVLFNTMGYAHEWLKREQLKRSLTKAYERDIVPSQPAPSPDWEHPGYQGKVEPNKLTFGPNVSDNLARY
jgi:hypothetical protein